MPKFKLLSHLTFPRSEQGGIIFLSATIVLLLVVQIFVDFSSEPPIDLNAPELVGRQVRLDSLYQVALAAKQPKLYPFNPNFISDYKAYTLDMPTAAYDKLQRFREKDQWINSKEDFKRITGVSDAWLDSIAPYFKFPEWVNATKKKTKRHFQRKAPAKSFSEKIDLNAATEAALQQVSGIGPTLSKRIVAYRNSLNGFSDEVQLYAVYGLSAEVIQRIKQQFAVKTPKTMVQFNINKATASDLATIPGVSFDLAKEIWEFVRLREGIATLEELQKIEGITAHKLARIQLYLSVQ